MSSSHYIRTIHTSFTAAHPSPWASAASRSSPSSFLSSSSSSPSSSLHQHQPLYSSSQMHQNSKGLPPTAPVHHTHLAPTASGAGGRRRAYAFRVPPPPPSPHQHPSSPSAYAPSTPRPKFDPFADEPTSPVPSIAHLASLSTPPTPRLAAASLPPPLSHRSGQGYAQGQARRMSAGAQGYQGGGQGFAQHGGAYAAAHGPSHYAQAGPRRSGFPGQRSRSPAPSFILDSPSSAHTDARSLAYSAPTTTEVWRHTSASPSIGGRRQQQNQVYEQEFEYDLGVPVGGGGNGGLVEPITSRRIAPPMQGRVSGPAPRRSPPPPSSILARRSPSPPSASPSHRPFTSPSPVSRPLTRTPSPPTHAPMIPTQKSAAQLQAEKESRAKLVAGILLNRIHVQKRSGRRVPSPVGGGKVYVPSGLSREVVVGA
ncbi:hypothetical protein FA13DRAFT_804587 [Coprinellus micaceus]|uniref:Uncharacterized protein n=1 Tax=Coprinellus micaceus TaxID=71717 RepID=A0A4Y7T406_COPMI|nr:hypothetical protein FA13DRAFT_804587 [Coprinellus micaceus]